MMFRIDGSVVGLIVNQQKRPIKPLLVNIRVEIVLVFDPVIEPTQDASMFFDCKDHRIVASKLKAKLVRETLTEISNGCCTGIDAVVTEFPDAYWRRCSGLDIDQMF